MAFGRDLLTTYAAGTVSVANGYCFWCARGGSHVIAVRHHRRRRQSNGCRVERRHHTDRKQNRRHANGDGDFPGQLVHAAGLRRGARRLYVGNRPSRQKRSHAPLPRAVNR